MPSSRLNINQPNSHTILLIQPDQPRQSRTFYDFSTLRLAVSGLTEIFQDILRKFNPGKKELSYTMADLHRYIDSLPVGIDDDDDDDDDDKFGRSVALAYVFLSSLALRAPLLVVVRQDLSLLVFDSSSSQYQPLTKQAIKGLVQDFVGSR